MWNVEEWVLPYRVMWNHRSLRRKCHRTHQQIFFCTFIEKVHLKKYTDILPFTDGRYRPSTRVHSLHCLMIPPAPDITNIPVFSTSVGFFLGGGWVGEGHGHVTCDIVIEQKDRLFNYKLYIFCTLLHQGATELCSIITNEKSLKWRSLCRNTWIHCLLADAQKVQKCAIRKLFVFLYTFA